MNADDIRILFGYHFKANRKLWDECVMPLTDEQFLRPIPYSKGSIRNQVVHLMDVEESWFETLRAVEPGRPKFIDEENWPTREKIHAQWDVTEADIRAYLDRLTDDICHQAFDDPRGQAQKWQVMIHVLNHGTDHRAQILAMLYQMGATTFEQDIMYQFWGQWS